MVDYAARVANELGATITKINYPELPRSDQYDDQSPFRIYNQLADLSEKEALEMVVNSAGRTGVLISGGSKISDEDLIRKVRISLEAGVDGLIFGRNMWQRPYEEALQLTKEIIDLMKAYD
jgi:class I fructose-bisphosphate aldolase